MFLRLWLLALTAIAKAVKPTRAGRPPAVVSIGHCPAVEARVRSERAPVVEVRQWSDLVLVADRAAQNCSPAVGQNWGSSTCKRR
jgi:hypothetical protein